MKDKAPIEKVCMMAGKMMLESGAETYRVEDTMDRIAKAYGADHPQSHVSTDRNAIFHRNYGKK